MRAVGLLSFGGPEMLQVLDVTEPHPEAGEVRIRVHAAAVNPTDTGLRSGHYRDRLAGHDPPYIPGMDAAGVVDEVGAGAPFAVGDRVMAIAVPTGPRGGAYVDELVVPAASAVPMPEGSDFPAAATLPLNGLTAWQALEWLALPPGATLAVTGAAGAFGGYVVQLGKVRGLRVIADASEADEALVRGLGADEVVRRGDDVAEQIRQVVPGGVDGLADGAVQFEKAAAALRDGGAMVVVRNWDDPGGVTVRRLHASQSATDTAALDELRQLASKGALTLRVADVLAAADAAEAHRRLERGGMRGRLVLDFST